MSASRPPWRHVLLAAGLFAVVGAVQGTVVGLLYDAQWRWTTLASARMALALLFWLPVWLVVSREWRTDLAPVRTTLRLALGAVAVVVLEPLWFAWIDPLLGQVRNPYAIRVAGRADTNLVFYLAIVGVGWLVAARRAQDEATLAAARMEAALADLELRILTSQLQPHFLFNTLNLVSQLAYESEDRALATLANLRRLLTESIEHARNPEVALADELRFVQAYLDIQRSRFGERLAVSIDGSPDVATLGVPHLLLQPLVENAIVHGLASRSALGRVHVTAERTEGRLAITVGDDGVGLPATMHEGVGLANTRLRLRRLYGDDHSLRIESTPGAGTRVVLDLPARPFVPRADDAAEQELVVAPPARRAAPVLAALARLPIAARVVLGWCAVAVLWMELAATTAAIAGRPFVRWQALLSHLVNASIWMALTPLVLGAARRIGAVTGAAWRRRAAYAAAGALATVGHLAAWLAVERLWHPTNFIAAMRSSVGWALWDALAFTVLVVFAHLARMRARLRDARLALERTQGELARARAAELRLRLQPAILVAGLDAVHRSIRRSPMLAESVIARLGDLLRLLLDAPADESLISAQAELASLEAYADLADEPRVLGARAPAAGA